MLISAWALPMIRQHTADTIKDTIFYTRLILLLTIYSG
jgi:hypothetical protein